jgi:biopolymer transport protein ExbD
MKKLILLISFLTLSLNSFSQTDTTKVTLPTKVVRLAAKDLIRYDGCKVELKLTQEKVIKLQEREIQKDTIISLLTTKDKNNQFIITQKDAQIGEYKGMTDDLKKELKGQRNKTFLYKVGTFIGLIATTFLLIK